MKNKLDFKKYKYIVTSGCSYGVVHLSFGDNYGAMGGTGGEPFIKDWINEISIRDRFTNTDSVISISASLPSSGAKWQSDSSIYIIKKLLDLGVPSENIYCYIEWSEFMRLTQIIPYEYGDNFKILNRKKWRENQHLSFLPSYGDRGIVVRNIMNKPMEHLQTLNFLEEDVNVLRFLHEEIKISMLESDMTIGCIEDVFYVTPSQIQLDRQSLNLKKFNPDMNHNKIMEFDIRMDTLIRQLFEVDRKLSNSNLLEFYLDSIIKTQLFLKLNNINHNFTFINSQLSDFYKQSNMHYYFTSRYFEDRLSKLDELKNLEEVYVELKPKMELLDLTKFSFFENEIYKRGGIDEFLYDKFGETIYCRPFAGDRSLPKHAPLRHIINKPIKGHHPREILYSFVWDFVAKDCPFIKIKKEWLDLLEEKFWADYNCDDISIHGVSISKKFYDSCQTKII